VDVVDIFRRPEDIPGVAEDAIVTGAKAVGMPEGVSHEGAAARARARGVLVVMDRCMKKELERLRRAG
jgi:predicted CoA-binding protein